MMDAVVVPLAKPVRLSMNQEKPRHNYDLGCGCKLFYPDLAQGTN
jgi:hypothetical protein